MKNNKLSKEEKQVEKTKKKELKMAKKMKIEPVTDQPAPEMEAPQENECN